MDKIKLIDICNPKQWKTIATSQLLDNGKFPVYGANGIIGYYNEFNHEDTTVLITCRGATCGNVHISIPKSYINGNAMALDNLNEKICLKEYLYYFLNYYDMTKIISGSAQPQITIQGLKKIYVKIYSIEEQKNIIKVLNKIKKVIDLKEKQVTSLDNIIKSQFVEMFGDIKNDDFDNSQIKDLVDTNIIKTKKKFKKNDVIKYIDISSINNIKNEIIGFTEYKIGEEPSRAQQCLVKGDILISTVRPNLKNIAVNYYNDENIIGSSGFCVLRPNKCELEYLLSVVKSEKFTNDMVAKTTGANYPAIHSTDILNYEIAVPPIELQNQFADIVKQIDKQKFEIENSLKEMQELYESLMEKYFG